MQVGSATLPIVPRSKPKLVAIGDSLTAGMQDLNLVGSRQQHSYPALIARQAGLDFKQPLLTEAGIPPKLFLSPNSSLLGTAWRYAMTGIAQTIPSVAVALGFDPPELLFQPLYNLGQMGKREQKGEIHNFGIPGFEARHLSTVANVHDWVDEVQRGVEGRGSMLAEVPYTRQILQGGRSARHGVSEIDAAVQADPDLVMLWAGNNDVLAGAVAGEVNDSTLTPMEDRQWKISKKTFPWSKQHEALTDEIMPGFRSTMEGPQGLVTRLLRETDADVMLMNIPDVTVVPHLFKVGEKVGALPFRMMLPGGIDISKKIENWRLPNMVKGHGKEGREYYPEGSQVGLGTILKKLTHYYKVKTEEDVDAALMAMARGVVAGQGVFSEDEVLDPQEIGAIQSRVREYNALLRDIDEKNDRVHLVDINGLLQRAAREGIPLRGEGPAVTATNTFTGSQDARGFEGIFSFDGVHPSDIGYAVIANQILDKARQELGDDPRFAAIVQAAPVDEKAALAQDPHRDRNMQLLLDGYVSDQLGG